jgi:3-oxoacyl-[acyl-carrier protein] reductase
MKSVTGKVVLITGGSRGMGAEMARVFAAAGARVVITHRDSAPAAAEVLRGLGGSGHRAIQANVEDTAAIQAMARSIQATEGRLDILVNNAGRTKPIPHRDLAALDDEFFDLMMRTNVRGLFACVRACRDMLKASGDGLIVNISSVAGVIHNGSNIAYCASKAAVNSLTVSLARALAPEIRVVAVAPGLIETEMARMWAPELKKKMIDASPIRRIGEAREIADTVLAMATHVTYATGSILLADGGRAVV